MPWCPKCGQEYREGILLCADCKVELVDEEPEEEIEMILLVTFEDEGMAARLIGFMNSQKIEAAVSQDENGAYSVLVAEKDLKKAKSLFNAFYTVEAENAAKKFAELRNAQSEQEDSKEEDNKELLEEDEKKDIEEETKKAASGVYETKAEKGKDLKSTAYTFTVFGIAGFIFLILNITGVISLYNNLLAYIVMTVMFSFFIYTGITSFRDSKKAIDAAKEEDKLTKDIKDFLKANVNRALLESYDDAELEEEMNFIKRMEMLKRLIVNKFGEQDDSYLDMIVEEFYNENFEEISED